MRALMVAQLKLIRTVPVLRKNRGVRRPEAKGLQETEAILRKADIRLRCKIRRSRPIASFPRRKKTTSLFPVRPS